RELGRKRLDAPRGAAPQGAQLKVGDGLGGFLGPAEGALERGHLLLRAVGRALLELQPVEQPVALVIERIEFLLELRAVLEQRDEALVLGRGSAVGQPVEEATQTLKQAHARSARALPRRQRTD